jgi:hypothetical protein
VVSAGGVETPYVRAGRGPTLVLVARDIDLPEVQALVADFAQRFTVFAASPDSTSAAELAQWLRPFLEGLGVVGVHLMVHESLTESLIV